MRKLIVSIFCLAVAVSASAKDYYASMFGIKSNGTTLKLTRSKWICPEKRTKTWRLN